MAKIDRYNGNLKAFASDATGTERTIFGDTAQSDELDANITADLLRGWGVVGPTFNPTKQDFNGLGFTLGQLIAYLHQQGVPEWNAAQEYYEGSVVTTLAGIYRLKNGGDATVDPDNDNGTNWELAPTRIEVDGKANLSGDSFTGSVGIGATPTTLMDNGKGLALGDTDSGIRQNGDGVIEVVANNEVRATVNGTGISATNLSGTNTGDQDLSGKANLSGASFSGSVGIGTTPTGFLNDNKSLALGDGDTGISQQGDGVLKIFTNGQTAVTITASGLSATNLSGTNTGDQDLSGKADKATTYTETEVDNLLDDKANISGQAFTGNISAPNLSGTNTGDQTLSEIGVGQTWQDVTSSRSTGVVYTNNTGKPISVFVKGGSAGPRIKVGSHLLDWSQYNGTDEAGTAIVPAGSTYEYISNFVSVSELR